MLVNQSSSCTLYREYLLQDVRNIEVENLKKNFNFKVLVGFSCWCCYFCPLYKQLYECEEDEGIEQEQPIYSTQQRQQQFEE